MKTLPASRTPDPRLAPSLRWGVLGPGVVADRFAVALQAHTGQRLVAVGSRSIERAARFAQRHGVPRAYGDYGQAVADPDVDAVYIAVPAHAHLSLALAALAAGKHVLVEKPFARNASEARELVAAARAANVTLMEAMWTRFLPGTDVIRQLLDANELGELHLVTCDHGHRVSVDGRMYDPSAAGGALLDIGVYGFAFANFVLGEPSSICAVGSRTQNGLDAQEAVVLSDFSQHPGALAVLSSSMVAATSGSASICGSSGRIDLPKDFYQSSPIRFVDAGGNTLTSAGSSECQNEALCYEIGHFATLVAEGAPESPLMSHGESVAIMAQMDAARARLGVSFPGE